MTPAQEREYAANAFRTILKAARFPAAFSLKKLKKPMTVPFSISRAS